MVDLGKMLSVEWLVGSAVEVRTHGGILNCLGLSRHCAGCVTPRQHFFPHFPSILPTDLFTHT